MPHSISARKRVRQNLKARQRNRAAKTFLKTRLKKLEAGLAAGSVPQAAQELVLTARSLDKAAHKRVIHRNRAARKKSRLAKRLNKLAAQAKQA